MPQGMMHSSLSLCVTPRASCLQLSLGWLYLFMGVLIGSCVPAIALCMFWERLAGVGMVAGSMGGSCLALIVWLAVASTYPGGLRDFFNNTGVCMIDS